MEINVTHLLDRPERFFASIAELGSDAGPITWRNAMAEAKRHPLFTAEQLPAIRRYYGEFGAWEREEIDAFTPQELNAIGVQLVAGDVREREHYLCDERLGEWEGGSLTVEDDSAFYYFGV